MTARWARWRWTLAVMAGFFFVGSVSAESVESLAKPSTYVADFAGVVDEGSKASLEALSREVYEKAHATIEIVTIKSLDGITIEDFTTQLEDKWKVGPKGSDRGVVMVFAIAEHKRRIEVGYGLEGILNDAKVGDIGREMVPQLQQGEYGPAILTGAQAISTVIAADANVTLDAAPQHTYHRERVRQGGRGIGFGGLVLIIFVLIFLFSRGGRGGGGSGLMWFVLGNMLGGGRRGGFGDGGGGGFGGGGGGSDGGDFGGGFGGSSGGGGASGDW